METLQIYSQAGWHDNAIILGDIIALQRLKTMIDVAIEHKQSVCTTFSSDGEGYDLTIGLVENPEDWNYILDQYTEEYAHSHNGVHPLWYLKGKQSDNETVG
jgi:hypothetical protein